MIVHTVLFQFRDDAAPELIAQFHNDLALMRQRLVALIVDYKHGPALHLRHPSADYAVVAMVKDETSLHAYLDDNEHRAVTERYSASLFKHRLAAQIAVPTNRERGPSAGDAE